VFPCLYVFNLQCQTQNKRQAKRGDQACSGIINISELDQWVLIIAWHDSCVASSLNCLGIKMQARPAPTDSHNTC
jgi:hypothetical protein